jgi:hypothetical protein
LTIPNPDHLFEQAHRLVEPHGKGAPRQVDIRRAISAAYYGVFHFILRETADQFIGVALRGSPLHALAYRSVAHARLADLCEDARKSPLPARLAVAAPAGAFSRDIRDFAGFLLELREKREAADYDPSLKFRIADAAQLVQAAKSAINRFQDAPNEERRAFLALLVFAPGRGKSRGR